MQIKPITHNGCHTLCHSDQLQAEGDEAANRVLLLALRLCQYESLLQGSKQRNLPNKLCLRRSMIVTFSKALQGSTECALLTAPFHRCIAAFQGRPLWEGRCPPGAHHPPHSSLIPASQCRSGGRHPANGKAAQLRRWRHVKRHV